MFPSNRRYAGRRPEESSGPWGLFAATSSRSPSNRSREDTGRACAIASEWASAVPPLRLRVLSGISTMTVEAKLGNPDGTFDVEKLRLDYQPPKGFDLEYLSGPMKGTKHTHTYTPQGNKTRVVVEGEFVVPPGMTENAVRKNALDYFAMTFEEDNSALKKY